MNKEKKINIDGHDIRIVEWNEQDYISLTDMVAGFGDETMIYSWMRNRNTVEFLGLWESMYNINFNTNEFVTFKSQAGLNNFNLTPKKWVDKTGAIGIKSESGRYSRGTIAHKDIAFEFGTWISPHLKLYLIREFQRLKEEESSRLKLSHVWDSRRLIAKANYKIQTDAIKVHLIPLSNLPHDKAFSVPGRKTNKLMASDELLHPRISKYEIKNIILGGGQHLLSPERRFDAALVNAIEIFK